MPAAMCQDHPDPGGALQGDFLAPERLKADGKFIKVEAPGFACPSWADLDGDGQQDLIVGQLKEGKLSYYRNRGENEFEAGQWLSSEEGRISVPGVW